MASKIPSLGLHAPAKLIKIKDFKVSGDFSIFPPEFLPDDTAIDIKSKVVGGLYELSWTNGKGQTCSIADLAWTPLGPPRGLTGTYVTIQVDGLLLFKSPEVCITPTDIVNGDLRTWKASIQVGGDGTPVTPTTGTFVAQTSTDGGNDGTSNLVTHAVRASTDS